MTDLLRLLRDKHRDDVFVDECVVSRRSMRRMDAWVLKTTWSPVTMVGYEIKVARSDFLRDDKWPEYVPYCHEFWFVAPSKKVIRPEEVPEGHGLMYATSTGNRLYTKVKAKRRQVELPANLLATVLMNRAKILEPYFSERGQRQRRGQSAERTRAERLAEWEEWLQESRRAKDVGYQVSGRVAEIARRTAIENEELRVKLGRWGRFRARLLAHGVDPEADRWDAERQLDKFLGALPRGLAGRLRRYAATFEEAAQAIEGLKK